MLAKARTGLALRLLVQLVSSRPRLVAAASRMKAIPSRQGSLTIDVGLAGRHVGRPGTRPTNDVSSALSGLRRPSIVARPASA